MNIVGRKVKTLDHQIINHDNALWKEYRIPISTIGTVIQRAFDYPGCVWVEFNHNGAWYYESCLEAI